MKGRQDWRTGVVTRAVTVAQGIRSIEFAVEGDLPPFDPGSHVSIRVDTPSGGAIRSYSCIPAPDGRIRIAVKLHEASRGGSRFMWSLIEGARVGMTAPENRFEISWRAESYLVVAGGIGITPMYGMAKALAGHGAPLRMAYGAKSRSAMAFATELENLLGARFETFAADEGKRVDLEVEIARLPVDGELYICGPLAMLNDARRAWEKSGRPVSRLRFEVFGDSGELPEMPFAVEIANSNIRVNVRSDESLLDALAAAGIDLISDCRRGECGLCAVDVLECEGRIDHRDVFFSDEEKKLNRRLCACVSRIAGGRAVIDTGYRVS